MSRDNDSQISKISEKRFGCLQVLGFVVGAVIITAGVTIFVFKTYFFPSEFKPVTLNATEEKVLAEKLERFDPNAPLEPEPYDEEGIKREINFTERELNGLLAKNTNLAKKLAIDLSDDLISAKLLLPVDEDFPVFGGKILRLRSGMTFTYNKGKPVVIFKGITIMGVPMPNAWLGGIKNIDLVQEFGAEKGFWKTFADGVEDIRVEEGRLKITLKE